MQYIAISPEKHKSHAIFLRQNFAFAKSQITLPVVLDELSQLLPTYPLAFVMREEKPELVALVGDGTRNLFVGPQDLWIDHYVPAQLRAFPFSLIPTGDNKLTLCIEENHLTQDSDAPSIFNTDGSLSDKANEFLEFLKSLEQSKNQTKSAVQKLVELHLLKPWSVDLPLTEDKVQKLTGLYCIDEQALNDLEPVQFAQLRATGSVALAYAQLFSMHNIKQLTKRAKFLKEHNVDALEVDLEKLFGEDDDTFKF